MLMRFDDARHWVPIYRARLGTNAPAIQMRICTSFLPETEVLPNDVPSHRGYPPAFMMKLLSSIAVVERSLPARRRYPIMPG
jgi:hypothetical protein